MFDHLFLSRSEEEIKKRVIYLVQQIEKEDIPDDNMKGKPSMADLSDEIKAILEKNQRELDKTLSKMNISQQESKDKEELEKAEQPVVQE